MRSRQMDDSNTFQDLIDFFSETSCPSFIFSRTVPSKRNSTCSTKAHFSRHFAGFAAKLLSVDQDFALIARVQAEQEL